MKRQLRLLFVCFLFAFVSLFSSIPVNAETQNEPVISENESSDIWINMERLNVPVEKRAALAEKINNAELLDCDNPLFCNMQPVQKGWISDKQYIEKYVYPDGSVKTLEINLEQARGTGISDGSYSSYTNWYSWIGALVKHTSINIICQFYASFSGSHDSGSISSVYDPGYYVSNGTVSNASLTINQQYASSSPAYATYYFEVSGEISRTCRLRLHVPAGASAYATFSY